MPNTQRMENKGLNPLPGMWKSVLDFGLQALSVALLGFFTFPFRWYIFLAAAGFLLAGASRVKKRGKGAPKLKWDTLGATFLTLSFLIMIYSPLLISRRHGYIYYSGEANFWGNRVYNTTEEDIKISTIYLSDPVRRLFFQMGNPFFWKDIQEIGRENLQGRNYLTIPVKYALELSEPSPVNKMLDKTRFILPMSVFPVEISLNSINGSLDSLSEVSISPLFGIFRIVNHSYLSSVEKVGWTWLDTQQDPDERLLTYISLVSEGIRHASTGGLEQAFHCFGKALDLAPSPEEKIRSYALLANMCGLAYLGNLGSLQALFYWHKVFEELKRLTPESLVYSPHLRTALEGLDDFYGSRYGQVFEDKMEALGDLVPSQKIQSRGEAQRTEKLNALFLAMNGAGSLPEEDQRLVMSDYFDFLSHQYLTPSNSADTLLSRWVTVPEGDLDRHIRGLSRDERVRFYESFLGYLFSTGLKEFFSSLMGMASGSELQFAPDFVRQGQQYDRILRTLAKDTRLLRKPFRTRYADSIRFFQIWTELVSQMKKKSGEPSPPVATDAQQIDPLFLKSVNTMFHLAGLDSSYLHFILDDKNQPDERLRKKISGFPDAHWLSDEYKRWFTFQLQALKLFEKKKLSKSELAFLHIPAGKNEFFPLNILQLIYYQRFEKEHIPEEVGAIEPLMEASLEDLFLANHEKEIRICQICLYPDGTNAYTPVQLSEAVKKWIEVNNLSCDDLPEVFGIEGLDGVRIEKAESSFLKYTDLSSPLREELFRLKLNAFSQDFTIGQGHCFARLREIRGGYVPR